MDFLKPSFNTLKKYYQAPQNNLRLILSNYLERKGNKSTQAVTRTVYGVVRREKLLDAVIKKQSKRSIQKLETDVLILLRIGIYLLFYSDSYPDYAVVNELVTISREYSKGFVNAVLRRCVKEKSFITKILVDINDPHNKYSISELLIVHLTPIIPDTLEENLEYLNQEPVFHLRVNTKDFTFTRVKDVLTEEKITYNELPHFNSFEVKGSGTRLRQLLKEKKYFYFQNTVSQMISIIAAQFSTTWVLDSCAAPGSKTITLALLKPELKIVAHDISHHRMKLLAEVCGDFNLTNIFSTIGDISNPSLKNRFDLIILDAPCTSSGTLRKNPDLKLKITPELIKKNSAQQYDMLLSIITDFPGTPILYSVCSFIKEETEDVMDRILTSEPNVTPSSKINITDLSDLFDQYGFKYKKSKYGYYMLPDKTLNNDLFYTSLFKISKKNE